MNLLAKLEDWINGHLTLLGEFFRKLILKLTPQWFIAGINFFKQLPKKIYHFLIQTFHTLKSLNLKEQFKETHQKILSEVEHEKAKKPGTKIKAILRTPFVMVTGWFSDLSFMQTSTLIALSCASVFSLIGIIDSGKQIFSPAIGRTPASAPEEIIYERPDYYKKSEKYFELLSLRIPVYFAEINELRTIDIDLSATMTTRHSKNQLEKLEIQLRDHFVLNLEPIKTEFTLTSEGREIIRQKLEKEIELFMRIHKIEGEVSELKVTYALAN